MYLSPYILSVSIMSYSTGIMEVGFVDVFSFFLYECMASDFILCMSFVVSRKLSNSYSFPVFRFSQ